MALFGSFLKGSWDLVRSKMFPWLLLCILVLLCWGFYSRLQKEKEESRRLSSNQEALLSEMEVVKSKYGEEVSRVQALELSRDEFKDLYEKESALVKSLNLKIRRLEDYVSTVVVVHDTVEIPVEAPILVNDTVVRPFSFSDPWVSVSGNIQFKGTSSLDPAKIQLEYSVRDSIDVIIYREPRRFLFIRYGTKRYDCYIRSKNPKAQVTMGSCVILRR